MVTLTFARPALIRSGTKGLAIRSVTTSLIVQTPVRDVAVSGRPGKPGVKVENTADRPSPNKLFQQAVAMKDDRLPQTINFEGLADIVVRATISQARIVRIRILVIRL